MLLLYPETGALSSGEKDKNLAGKLVKLPKPKQHKHAGQNSKAQRIDKMPGGGYTAIGCIHFSAVGAGKCRKRCTGEKLKEFVQLGDEKQ